MLAPLPGSASYPEKLASRMDLIFVTYLYVPDHRKEHPRLTGGLPELDPLRRKVR